MDWEKIFNDLANEYIEKYPEMTVTKAERGDLQESYAEFYPETLEIFYSRERVWWRTSVMALAHEIGHMIDFLNNYTGLDSFMTAPEYVCERKAYFYGWAILKKAGLPINKNQWRYLHRYIKIREDSPWI